MNLYSLNSSLNQFDSDYNSTIHGDFFFGYHFGSSQRAKDILFDLIKSDVEFSSIKEKKKRQYCEVFVKSIIDFGANDLLAEASKNYSSSYLIAEDDIRGINIFRIRNQQPFQKDRKTAHMRAIVTQLFVEKVLNSGLLGFDFVWLGQTDIPFFIPSDPFLPIPNIPEFPLILHSGLTPLHLVRTLPPAQELIAQGSDIHARDDHQRTPLHRAALFGHYEVAELLLQHGSDINAQDLDGRTPLQTAVFFSHPELVDLLLNYGADPNLTDSRGMTALFLAAERNCIDDPVPLRIAEALLTHGADPNICDHFQVSPLHRAAGWSYKFMVDLLIKYGSQVNVQDIDGRTPLHEAAISYKENVYSLLSVPGIETFVKDKNKVTAPQLMRKKDSDLSTLEQIYGVTLIKRRKPKSGK